MSETKISWTDATWNPVTGCSHVSPGCEHCYAETLSLRFGWSKKPWRAQFAAENVVLHPERLHQPSHWKKPRRVFVNSMSDLFHELVPFEFIDQVFAEVVERGGLHTFQILTKRPERMREYMSDPMTPHRVVSTSQVRNIVEGDQWAIPSPIPWPPLNCWIGTSVEDQRRADERIPLLLDTPAAVRFLSCEPLLGPIDLSPWLWETIGYDGDIPGHWSMSKATEVPREDGLHWIIVGGESGPGYRSMDPAWARTLRDQCVAAGVPFFFKQSAGPRTEMGKELDGQRWEQFPQMPVRAGAR